MNFKETSPTVDIEGFNIKVIPNPAKIHSTKVLDIQGMEMLNERMDNRKTMSVKSLPSGIYYLVLDTETENRKVAKLIIQK